MLVTSQSAHKVLGSGSRVQKTFWVSSALPPLISALLVTKLSTCKSLRFNFFFMVLYLNGYNCFGIHSCIESTVKETPFIGTGKAALLTGRGECISGMLGFVCGMVDTQCALYKGCFFHIAIDFNRLTENTIWL